ncbi:hypothetical protein ACFQX7_33915 [Luedemannella flava]
MPHADLTAADWSDRTDESARRVARAIADERDLRFVGVHDHEYAGRRHRVALFDRDGLAFALVPGDRVTLGYDGTRFTLTPAQATSFDKSAVEYGLRRYPNWSTTSRHRSGPSTCPRRWSRSPRSTRASST